MQLQTQARAQERRQTPEREPESLWAQHQMQALAHRTRERQTQVPVLLPRRVRQGKEERTRVHQQQEELRKPGSKPCSDLQATHQQRQTSNTQSSQTCPHKGEDTQRQDRTLQEAPSSSDPTSIGLVVSGT